MEPLDHPLEEALVADPFEGKLTEIEGGDSDHEAEAPFHRFMLMSGMTIIILIRRDLPDPYCDDIPFFDASTAALA